jgi:putative transposase
LWNIIGAFKTTSSKLIHEVGFANFSWQKSFYDRVIRNETELLIKQQYILNNPPKWELDRNNPHRKSGKYYFEY